MSTMLPNGCGSNADFLLLLSVIVSCLFQLSNGIDVPNPFVT